MSKTYAEASPSPLNGGGSSQPEDDLADLEPQAQGSPPFCENVSGGALRGPAQFQRATDGELLRVILAESNRLVLTFPWGTLELYRGLSGWDLSQLPPREKAYLRWLLDRWEPEDLSGVLRSRNGRTSVYPASRIGQKIRKLIGIRSTNAGSN